MKVIIEKLKYEDLADAISIYDDNHNLKTNLNKLLSIYQDIYNNSLYHNIVAKVDGKIVGLATIIINYDIVEDLKPFITIWNLGIKKEYRRQNIGTEILKYIDKFASDNNCSFVSLLAEKDNKIAQAFYEKNGFDKEIGYTKYVKE